MKSNEKVIATFTKAYEDVMRILKKEPRKYDYTDIHEFEDAYGIVEDSQTVIGDALIEEYNKVKSIFQDLTYFNSLAKMRIVIFAASGCDESFPDWNNESQEKRYPWFEMNKPGVGVSFHASAGTSTLTAVGSRLVFKNAAQTKYFSEHKNFKPLYEIIFNK